MDWVAREGFSEEVTVELRSGGWAGAGYPTGGGMSFPGGATALTSWI